MSVTVTGDCVGDAGRFESVEKAIEEAFKGQVGDWRVTVFGRADQTAQRMEVSDPKGKRHKWELDHEELEPQAIRQCLEKFLMEYKQV